MVRATHRTAIMCSPAPLPARLQVQCLAYLWVDFGKFWVAILGDVRGYLETISRTKKQSKTNERSNNNYMKLFIEL